MRVIKFYNFKNFKLILLILFPFFMLGCSDDKPTEPDGKIIETVTKTIGPEGAEIVIDELVFNIPSATFNVPSDIEISTSITDNPFATNHLSKLYRIEGVPYGYKKPIKVKIKYEAGNSSGERFLALGEEFLSTSEISYTFIDSKDSSGCLIGEIPAPEQSLGSNNFNKLSAEGKFVFTVSVITGYAAHLSSQKHFIVYLPLAHVGHASTVDQYLEDSYAKILNLGFSYNARTNWPIKVTFRNFKDGLDALTTTSKLGDNYGYMELSENLFDNLPRLRATVGHEFFHIVQSFYDARSYLVFGGKGVSPPPNYWLNEATSAWIEEKFVDIVDYIPEVRGGHNVMALFNGLHQEVDAQNHGYGSSALIKFLVNKYGENILIKMYEDLLNSKHTIEAVCQYNPNEWWELFLQEYMLSNIYNDVGRATWFTNSKGEFKISSEADTLKIFTEDYQDLSGKLFRIIPKYSNISEQSVLVFNITGASNRYLQLFRFREPSTFEFLAADNNMVIVKDIKELTDNGWLIALVSNNRYTNPYSELRTIKLDIRINESNSGGSSEIFSSNRCIVRIAFNGHYKNVDQNGNITEEDKEDNWGTVVDYAIGSFSGNTFIGSYDKTLGSSNYKGTVVVTISNDHNLVTSVDWTENYTSYWQNNVDATSTSSFGGHDIPLSNVLPGNF